MINKLFMTTCTNTKLLWGKLEILFRNRRNHEILFNMHLRGLKNEKVLFLIKLNVLNIFQIYLCSFVSHASRVYKLNECAL